MGRRLTTGAAVKFALEAKVAFRAASEKNHSTRIATAVEIPRELAGEQ
jgi:hypothetical protein